MRRSAELSSCGRYRYELRRDWYESQFANACRACFVLCNPSTADDVHDDATVRKCIGFARRLDCGGLIIVNVCAWRSSKPRALLHADDAIGASNAEAIDRAIYETRSGPIVLGWGNALPERFRLAGMRLARRIEALGRMPLCLGYTADRQPRHPLMLAYDTPLEAFHISHPPS